MMLSATGGNRPLKQCIVCGVEFRKINGGHGWCCTRNCGDAFRAWQASLRRNTRRASGERIATATHKAFVDVRLCRDCRTFVSSGQRCEPCREAHQTRSYNAQLEAQRNAHRAPRLCTGCHVEFTPTYGNARYCSSECSRKASRRSPSGIRSKRAAKKARKARLRMKVPGVVATFDPFDVFRRDAWRCRLCGISTPERLRGTCAPNAPELDHIVPLSAGGPHTYDNTQCACRKCNGAKGNLVIGQFRLTLNESIGSGGSLNV